MIGVWSSGFEEEDWGRVKKQVEVEVKMGVRFGVKIWVWTLLRVKDSLPG